MFRKFTKVDDSASSLQQILGPKNRDEIERFLGQINDVAANLNGLVTRIEGTRQTMNGVLEGLGGLVIDNRENLASTLEGVDKSVHEMHRSLEAVNAHLDTILYHVEGSARQLHEFSRAIRENPARLLRGTAKDEVGGGQ